MITLEVWQAIVLFLVWAASVLHIGYMQWRSGIETGTHIAIQMTVQQLHEAGIVYADFETGNVHRYDHNQEQDETQD